MDKKSDEEEDEGHDECSTRPARHLKALRGNEGLDISSHFLLIFRRFTELSEGVHQIIITIFQCCISHCRLEEASKRLRIILDQLFFDLLILFITMDLESESDQDVVEQFNLRVDPLKHDPDLARTLRLQIVELILTKLVDFRQVWHESTVLFKLIKFASLHPLKHA